jgi:hypothetical protein
MPPPAAAVLGDLPANSRPALSDMANFFNTPVQPSPAQPDNPQPSGKHRPACASNAAVPAGSGPARGQVGKLTAGPSGTTGQLSDQHLGIPRTRRMGQS